MYHVTGGLKAVKYSPQYPGPTSTVSFSAGRILGGLQLINLGTIASAHEQYNQRDIPSSNPAVDYVTIYDRIIYLECSALQVYYGDYIPELNGNVCQIGNFGFGSYNLAVAIQDFGETGSIPGPVPSSGSISPPTIANNTHPSMSVWIEGGDSATNKHVYIPSALVPDIRYQNHATRYAPFTVSTSTYTFNGDTITLVSFAVNPTDARLRASDGQGGSDANHIANRTFKYSYRTNRTVNHSDAIKYFIGSAGLTTNAASFAQAITDLSGSEVSMTIPFEDTNSFPTYLKACQAITSSTIGVLGVDENREITYKILKTDPTPDRVRDNSDILMGESSSHVQYQDMVPYVTFTHPQLNTNQGISGVTCEDKRIASKEAFLHRSQAAKTIRHYMKDVTSCANRLANYLKNPTVEYNISTASKDLNASIGENVEITSKVNASESGTVKGLVVGVDSSSSKTTLKINEIRGL
jgi:hypothetical protein